MEWTKEILNRTFMICHSMYMQKKVVSFYESFGYEFWGNANKNHNSIFPCVIGIIAHNKDILVRTTIIGIRNNTNFIEIKLPTKPRLKFPREMMVSVEPKFQFACKRIVIAKIKDGENNFIAKDVESKDKYYGWPFAKEIEPLAKIQLSDIESLTDLKKRLDEADKKYRPIKLNNL